MRWAGHMHGGEKRFRVRVERFAIEIVCVSQLYQFAHVHHRHAVADVLYYAKIVGDEQVGQVQFALEEFEQVEDLRLH